MHRKKCSAKQLCKKYPGKHIAVNHLCKNKENIIVSAEVLKVYDTLDDCKNNVRELRFFLTLYKDDFDVIYGDYDDYINMRQTKEPVTKNAFDMFGAIAFEMFPYEFLFGK